MQEIEGINVKLYPHQIKGIEMIDNYEYNRKITINENMLAKIKNPDFPEIFRNIDHFHVSDSIDTKIGIYGDITGYGKTLTMLSYITKYYHNRRHNDNYLTSLTKYDTPNKTYADNSYIKHSGTRIQHYQFLPQTLVIINKQIANQWESELRRTDLKCLSISARKHIPNDLQELEKYELILCSNTMSTYLYNLSKYCHWVRIIIDEPTENYVPQYYKADFYWLITASYHNIPINTSKNTIIKELFPQKCGHVYIELMTVKNDNTFVKNSYSLPQIETVIHNVYENNLAYTIQSYISNELACMIAAGNIKDVILKLGGTSSDCNIVELVTKNKQEKLIEAQHKLQKYNQLYIINKNRDYKRHYDKWTENVQTLKNQLSEIEQKYEQSIENGCSICYCEFDKQNKVILVPCCQNIVCGVCIFNWFKTNQTCIFCRETIDSSELIYLEKCGKRLIDGQDDNTALADSKVIIKMKPKKMSRLEKIIHLIKFNPARKFIIVSYHDETFIKIKNHLKSNEIYYVEIKGIRSSIDKEIKKINDGICRVVFLNGRFMGTGLNLQIMTDIILYHKMDHDVVTQLIGRINRIGSNETRGDIQPKLHKFIINDDFSSNTFDTDSDIDGNSVN